MSEIENPLEESAPEESTEKVVEEIEVEVELELTEDELEEADCAPDTPTSPEAVGSRRHSSARSRRRNRGR